MLLNISAYATFFAEKVCGPVRSTWGTSQGEDKLGARDRTLNTKVAHEACAGRVPGKHSSQGTQVQPCSYTIVFRASPPPPILVPKLFLNITITMRREVQYPVGELYRVEFLQHKFCATFLCAICSVFSRVCTGIR